MPTYIGEQKTENGLTSEWNGSAWQHVPDPDFADLAARASGSSGSIPTYTNASLARKPGDWSTDQSAPFGTVPSSLAAPDATPGAGTAGGPYVAPDGGLAARDAAINSAKNYLAKPDPLIQAMESAGNRAQMESVAAHQPTPTDQFFENYGRGIHAIPSGVIPGAVNTVKALATMPFKGYADLAKLGAEAYQDPEFASQLTSPLGRGQLGLQALKNAVSDVGTAESRWATHPEEGGEAVGEAIGGAAAPESTLRAIAAAPGLAGGAISATGRGLQALGNSPLVKGTGLFRKAGAVLHPGIGTVLAATGPDLLPSMGRGLESLGQGISNIPNSAAIQGLKNALNTDVGSAFTRPAADLTPEEQAAARVKATVDAAKGYVDQGMSRGQAAQRAGWPLAGDYELNDFGQPVNKYGTGDLGHHPGQDVQAHWPYEPSVRGVAGNEITPGRNSPVQPKSSLGGLKNAIGSLDDLATVPKGPEGDMDVPNTPADDVEFEQKYQDALKAYGEAHPTPYETGIGAKEPLSPELMNRPQRPELKYAIRNATTKPFNIQGVNLTQMSPQNVKDLLEAHRTIDYELGHGMGPLQDLSPQLSTETNLARLSRGRALRRSIAGNSPLAEGQ
jgi:hypothetical protein